MKLFPLYSSAGAAPLRAHELWNWYMHGAAAHMGDLSLLALAPAAWLYAGLVVCVMLGLALSAAVIREVMGSG